MDGDAQITFHTPEGVPTKPLPKQDDAIQAFLTHKHTLMAGSLGWGKTDCMAVIIAAEAMKYPNNLILTGRKNLGSFRRSTLTNILDILPPEVIKRHNRQEGFIELVNKTMIYYMQLDASREAIKQIKSMNIGLAAVDQIEEISEEVFVAIAGQLRRKNGSRKTISTCNPAGHDWVWRKWVKERNVGDYAIVEGTIWKEGVLPPECQSDVTPDLCDNIHLPWDYIRDQLARPIKFVKRFIWGSWDSYEGLIWPELTRENVVIKPRKLEKYWNYYRILDHGHRNPTAVLWAAVDEYGRAFLFRAHYEANQWVEYHAKMIHAKSGDRSYSLDIADPSIFAERDSEKTIAKRYMEYGLYWTPGDNDIAGGIDYVAQMVLDKRLFVFDLPEFEPFWEEVEEYHWKDLGVTRDIEKEVPVKKKDHFCDDLRYFANFIYKAMKPPEQEEDYGFLKTEMRDSQGWMGI